MDAMPSADDRVAFALSLAVQQPEKGRLIDKATLGLTRQKPVVILTVTATTTTGSQQLFSTAVKVQQVHQAALGHDAQQVSKKVVNKEWVPLSLKVATSDQISAHDVVYVKVAELATRTGLTQDLRRIQNLPDNTDPIVDATSVSGFVSRRLIQQQEMIFRATNLQGQLEAPISSAAVAAADSCLARYPKMNEARLIALADNEQFITLRTKGSHSIQSTNKQPLTAWVEASRCILEMVLSRTPLTTQKLCTLHKILYMPSSSEPDKIPGIFRDTEVTVGGFLGASYLHPRFIEKEMEKLVSWISVSIPRCQAGQLNPIVVAARAYQNMVSIHPFCDGNGRVCRLVMDYVLQSCGRPPALLGDNVEVAIFGLQDKATSHLKKTPDDAVLCVIQGVNKSYELA